MDGDLGRPVHGAGSGVRDQQVHHVLHALLTLALTLTLTLALALALTLALDPNTN